MIFRGALNETVYSAAKRAITLFAGSREYVDRPTRFNKATLYSWLYFLVKAAATGVLTEKATGQFIAYFEDIRTQDATTWQHVDWQVADAAVPLDLLREVVDAYTDRATARVNDTSSVLARDIAIWCIFYNFLRLTGTEEPLAIGQFSAISSSIDKVENDGSGKKGEAFIAHLIQAYEWEEGV